MGRSISALSIALNEMPGNFKNEVKKILDDDARPNRKTGMIEQAELAAKFVHTQDDRLIAMTLLRGKEMPHYHVKYQDLVKNIGKFTDIADAYCSVNSFSRIPRSIEYLWKLNAFYCDIDFYNEKSLKHMTAHQVLEILRGKYFDKVVPPPNLIISSGRGLNLFWVIEPVPATKKAFNMWRKLQDKFLELLLPLGADANSIDAARIFRIPGSLNSKSQQNVQILEHNPVKFTMRELGNKYLPPLVKLVKTKKINGWKPQSFEKQKRKSFFNLRTLHYNRIQDIVKLQEMRVAKNDPDMKEGLREVMCFLYRYWCNCYYGDKSKTESELEIFNANFIEPLQQKELKATVGADKFYEKWLSNFDEQGNIQRQNNDCKYKFKGYNYSNAKLINVLKISLEEQIHLSTIISKEEKKHRYEIRQATNKGELGPSKREQQKQASMKKVQAAIFEYPYYSQQKIADITGISRSHVSKILKVLNNGKNCS